MDVDSWRRVFQIARQYGINHYRCHSYTPPVAAMRAADIEGVYLAVELPVWGSVKRKKRTDLFYETGRRYAAAAVRESRVIHGSGSGQRIEWRYRGDA